MTSMIAWLRSCMCRSCCGRPVCRKKARKLKTHGHLTAVGAVRGNSRAQVHDDAPATSMCSRLHGHANLVANTHGFNSTKLHDPSDTVELVPPTF